MDTISFFHKISTLEWIITCLFIVFFIIQILYYLYLFRKPYKHSANYKTIDLKENELPGISIIITAKNEAENIAKNLPFILNQDYPNFQVVVVENASTDGTADVLESFRNNHPNLYVTFIPIGSDNINNKKLALTLGVKAAKHDILLFTEPDTKPLSNKWVYEYAKRFNNRKDIVLGCCQIEIEKSYFKKYILFDNLMSGIKYTSMAIAGKPYMGIGRNMAFRKDLFFSNKGLSSVLNIEDGEDNVFLNKIITNDNTAIVSSPASMVVSNVVDGISNWKKIKTRYLTTRKYYIGNKAKLINFEEFTRYGFYMLFITMMLIGIFSTSKIIALIAIALFIFRYILQAIIINRNSKVFNAGNFYFSLPLFDLATPAVNYFFMRRESKRSDIMADH